MNRRRFVRQSAAAAAAGAVLGPAALSPPARAATGLGAVPDALGVQLYMVRDLLANDMAGTLETLARLGYRQVEAKSMHGRAPQDVRALLDVLGLTCPSVHADLLPLRDDAEAILDKAVTLGAEYLVLAWFDEPERPPTLDGWAALADELNALAQRAADAGLRFAYHNHAFEFASYGGDRPAYDVLLDRLDPSLVDFQIDFYWAAVAGYDPVEYVRRHPGRFPLWHLKDAGPDDEIAPVGAGRLDWRRIFATSETAGLRYLFVDAEDTGRDLATARASIDFVRTLQDN